MSTSQALDMRLLLIMLMIVQGTTPKNSSSEVPEERPAGRMPNVTY